MSEGPKKAADNINVLAIATIGVVSTLLVWASVIGLQAYYNATEGTLALERETSGQDTAARTIKAKQELELSQFRIVDAKSGRVTIDVAVAKELIIKELSAAPGGTVVPALGTQSEASIPAVWGRPPDDLPAAAAPAPADGAAPAPADGAAPAPVDGAAPAPKASETEAPKPGATKKTPEGGHP